MLASALWDALFGMLWIFMQTPDSSKATWHQESASTQHHTIQFHIRETMFVNTLWPSVASVLPIFGHDLDIATPFGSLPANVCIVVFT